MADKRNSRKSSAAHSFGFDPEESRHHFVVGIPRGNAEEVSISEHFDWDDAAGSTPMTLGERVEGQIRVILARPKWDAIAHEVRAEVNQRLKKMGRSAGAWRAGPNLVRRELGKELVMLAWAVEDADPRLIPDALAKWKGLYPEERWWLYTQTAAATGHGVNDRGRGWRRKDKAIPQTRLLAELIQAQPGVQGRFLDPDAVSPTIRKKLSAEERHELQKMVFKRMPYSEKLRYCCRPEQIEGPSAEAWGRINAHLGTHADSLPELVADLGERRFGHRPRVGDSFCGAGSVPFEAARLGCDAYGSDLSPVAALLTWAALHIVGGGESVAQQVKENSRRFSTQWTGRARTGKSSIMKTDGGRMPISIAWRSGTLNPAGWYPWPHPG
jgi:hypothetical protein